MMKINVLTILLTFFLLTTGVDFMQAQTVALDKICLKHLGERANSLKVKTYATRIDEMDGSIVVLKEQFGSIKGVMYFPKGKKSLLMSGSKSLLYLRDEHGFDSGKLKYSIDNQEFKGELISAFETNIATVRGRYTEDVPVLPPACFVDKWLVYHEGHIVDGENVYLNLQRIGNGDLQGIIYFSDKKVSASLTGIIVDSKVDLVVIGKDGKRIGDLYGRFGKNGDFEGTLATGTSRKTIHSLPVISDGQSCSSSISSAFRYSIVYPKLNIDAFDDVMDEQSIDWVKYCEKKMAISKSTGKRSAILNESSAFSYVEVHCRDKAFFSGFQIFFDPSKEVYFVKSINFDVKKNRFLSSGDLFDNQAQLDLMVTNRARKNLGQHPLKDNQDFVKWVSAAKFDQFVLQPDGVLFGSPYHPIYGKYHVLISYPELKGYIKNKKIVKHFRKLK